MEKKIIGFKLIKEYPRSEKIGTEVVAPSVRDVILNNDFYHMKGNYEIAVFANVINGWPEFWQPIYEEEKVISLDQILTDNGLLPGLNTYKEINKLMKATAEQTIDFVIEYLSNKFILPKNPSCNEGIVRELKDKIK